VKFIIEQDEEKIKEVSQTSSSIDKKKVVMLPTIKEEEEEKEFYICPITLILMTDPVICADGHSYERAAIEEWLVTNNTSPSTGVPLPHKHLVPNIALKQAIEASN